MKKKLLFLTFLLSIFFFNTKDTYAYSSSNYINRTLCGTFEVAQFKSNGSIEAKSCHSSFEEAQASMRADGGVDLALLARFGSETKIIDANAALVDFTNTSNLIYLYSNHELSGDAHTYMNGQSAYGAVDGAQIGAAYSLSASTFVTRVKIGGFDGWVRSGVVEIVPLVWVKSSSSYTVSNESIRHNYVSKIQNTYNGSSGNTIGPKPEMLDAGTYYSYDGHYFYTDRYKMINDYQHDNYNNSVNKDKPYYNYYQFLSNHTRTTYSSINIDEYIRNVLGYGRDVYGNDNSTHQGIKTSRLYGKGTFFYNAQELYGVNALLALGLSRNETGNGTSNLAINKNNGFGLNAVDSNPTQAANWYATFSSSILGYANKWVTYGYSNPSDWRYFGNQYGNKYVGMNVKYASDVYWGEKMASNYYYIDKALGMQDYNYYQIGVTKNAVQAMSQPNYNSKAVYKYRSAENSLVIIDEVEGQEVNGNKTWYKVVSDLNIDSNFNKITSGEYNWDAYVYVPAAYVIKANEGKNGYISPNEVTEYQDKNYTYDLYIEDTVLKPKVAISIKETNYYYDPSLLSAKGQKLLNNRYVMVFTAAYDEEKNPVAYLVTSDYKYDQKHWVSADSIKFVTSQYGQASVTVEGKNTYTIINPDTVDSLSTHFSGLYHYAYVPILEEKTVDGYLWYKVPVDLSGTTHEFGWTLASAPDVLITKYQYTATNVAPIIKAKDLELLEGEEFDELAGVTATDPEDGDLTDNIEVISNNVNTKTPGEYQVSYRVVDKQNTPTVKTIKVTVLMEEEPVITANDITTTLGKGKPNLLENVTATDKEDGNLTENITIDDSQVKYDEIGEYKVIYKVKDSFGHEITKEIKLTIKDSQPPVINATDKTITIGTKFDPNSGVTATDEEDGDLTENIKIIKNTVKEDELGTYEVIYQVTDNHKHTVEKTIKVTVSERVYEKKEALYVFDSLTTTDDKLTIKGSLAIAGIQHTLLDNITYKLIFENNNTKEKLEQELTRIISKDEIPFEIKDGEYDYTYSWFKGNISFSNIPAGDYTLYVAAYDNKSYYTETVLSNVFGDTMDNTYNTTNTNVTIRNNYESREAPIQMFVREESLGEKNTSSRYNMNNEYSTIEFKNNKLIIRGASHIIGGDYSPTTDVTRTMIFENIESFKTNKFDIGSITTGDYQIELRSPDGKDKTRAWYETNIDVSSIEKGTYSIYISTQSNLADYGELQDIFANRITAKQTIDGKTYSFKVDRENRYRILLVVE